MTPADTLSGRVAVVTGGARGIGAATAGALAARGAAVAILDVDESAAIGAAADLATATGVRTLGVRADVGDEAGVDDAFRRVEADLGPVGILVNNAGILTPRFVPAEEVSPEEFDRMLAVHVRGSFLCSRRALPGMKARGEGRIVMLSSLVGPLGFDRRVAYATAKEGIVGMMRALAVEAGPSGVTVNAVAPGWIRTALVDERLASGVLDEAGLLSRTPLQRWGAAADVADVIAAVCGPGFSYVTGVEIPIDGGFRMCGDTLTRERAA
jgi:NAD(P)-dependent dehydrogenase (short-subunit alcohol dehydrogenase family)